MFTEAIRLHDYIKNPNIYAVFDIDSKIYVKNTDEQAKNGIIVLVNRGDKV